MKKDVFNQYNKDQKPGLAQTPAADVRPSVTGRPPCYDMTSCGKRIRQLRKAHGYTQEGLADQLGIDRSFLSRIEAGTKGCSVDLFIALASVFHTSLDHLILGAVPQEGKIKAELHTLIEKLTQLEKQL